MSYQGAEPQAAVRPRYRQTVGPYWSDSEGEYDGTLSQASVRGRHFDSNEHGEPLSPPPPYSEQGHDLGGGPVLLNSRVNLYPGEGGRAEYVTDEAGRRERYIINENGERVPWPFPDHENSSDDGDGDSDMVHLESGRILPRSEWEADHPWEYSSDDPSDDSDQEMSQSHRCPMPRTSNSTPRHWSSGDDKSDSKVPKVRSGHNAGSRYRRRQSLAGGGGQSRHGTEERNIRRARRCSGRCEP